MDEARCELRDLGGPPDGVEVAGLHLGLFVFALLLGFSLFRGLTHGTPALGVVSPDDAVHEQPQQAIVVEAPIVVIRVVARFVLLSSSRYKSPASMRCWKIRACRRDLPPDSERCARWLAAVFCPGSWNRP